MQSGKYTVFPGRADHVPLSSAQGAGERHRAARKYPAVHLRRCDHARDVEPGVRGAVRDAAARRLRHHRDLHDGHHELAPRRAANRFVRTASAGPRRAHHRSVLAGGRSLRRRGRIDRTGAEPDAGLSQQARGNRGGAAQGLVSHRRSCEVGPVRLPDDHRPHQGTDHPRRPEHRTSRDRGSRHPASARDGLRGGRRQACHARRSALPVHRGQTRRIWISTR